MADQRKNLKRLMLVRKLTESGAELTSDKAESNKGRGRGSGPGHPPKKVGVTKSRLMGSLAGKEAAEKDDDTIRDLVYRERKGESAKSRKGLAFTLRDQT